MLTSQKLPHVPLALCRHPMPVVQHRGTDLAGDSATILTAPTTHHEWMTVFCCCHITAIASWHLKCKRNSLLLPGPQALFPMPNLTNPSPICSFLDRVGEYHDCSISIHYSQYIAPILFSCFCVITSPSMTLRGMLAKHLLLHLCKSPTFNLLVVLRPRALPISTKSNQCLTCAQSIDH